MGIAFEIKRPATQPSDRLNIKQLMQFNILNKSQRMGGRPK